MRMSARAHAAALNEGSAPLTEMVMAPLDKY